jgi:quercetin dioxygenase-like cupin family protein
MSEHDELESDVLDALALGLPDRERPSDSTQQRLFQRVRGADRFLPFLDRASELFDLPERETEDHLQSIDRDDEWEDLVPGVRFRDFDGGEKLGEAHAGLIRVAAGSVFPHHTHVGSERILMLQGIVEDENGNRWRAGDVIDSDDGSGHEMRNVGDKEVIYAAVVLTLEFTQGDEDEDEDD